MAIRHAHVPDRSILTLICRVPQGTHDRVTWLCVTHG
ncbi:hypothetical protein F383_21923 [Gossypium arboreum]|uniref:Uncharacterized protein n=1 Tax=Gossypium arboreum TaxID=29729 RepID=A0A0B0P427_GOSAR|nr:hypothetical protein F383_21923 [Gossypium arboreum]